MRDKRTVDELSIEELEIILALKKRQARQARLRRLSEQGRVAGGASPEDDRQPVPAPQLHELVADVPAPDRPTTFDTTVEPPQWEEEPEARPPNAREKRPRKPNPVRPLAERERAAHWRRSRDRLLLVIEAGSLIVFLALVGAIAIHVRGLVEATNRELAASMATLPTPTVTPEIGLAIVLPGGHTPPTSADGARPNLNEIPEHLRPIVQSRLEVPVAVPTPGVASPVRIRIAASSVDHPVVLGDDWETLKRGVGHHVGSANPGQRGNMVLSAHNDIYGEIFRYLDQLEPGDEVFVYTTTQEYRYVVREWRIVSPTDVWVLAPTQGPTLTLISCYPYLGDTERIVVFADLVES
jgi:sortase A